MKNIIRCGWVSQDPKYIDYHDNDWGIEKHDDPDLLEFLILEGAQAGLSWITILKRRETYRVAFEDYDVNIISKYDENDVQRLLSDTGIIRNQLKIRGAINNAQKFLNVINEFGSFSEYLWSFVSHKQIINRPDGVKNTIATSPLSNKISLDLKNRGFKFVGPTIIYAYLQAVGVIDDHELSCFRAVKE